ncbi:DNA polymerase IV [Nonomuraea africana]|uniref:DNA polymerase-4 n=1 Tax=Nonomuraea africana TaxID=46171 RepID=A0ABR9KF68_9ACTN|nr:DNA polymerase IV [Nonomuraea africana]MBE1560635.1 DNA polymerase-4 [Nonomuraea africana]
MRDWVLHLDLDAFMAAVEILRNPELRGRPVIVGGNGDPTTPRTVVSTASYEAREYGVHSGMPMRTALRRCPDAVYLPTDLPAYEAASAAVMAVLRTFPVVVEVWGLDEAFLGARTDDPETLARDIQRAVTDKTGLTCSIGIGDNKHQAKLAAQFEKPSGVSRLTTDTWTDVMGERPTTALWGIGAKTAKKLADLGLHTVNQLAAADPAVLAARFGPTNGPWLRYLALGRGETTITTAPWVPRGHSHETTFTHDLTDPAAMRDHIAALAGRLATETEGRPVIRVTVKVRSVPFVTHTRQAKLPEPTLDAATIQQAALAIFDRFAQDRPVRLLGVSVEYA